MGDKKEYIERGALLDQMMFEMVGTGVQGRAMDVIRYANAADVVEVRHSQWDEDKYPFCNVCPECGLIIDRTCIKRNSGKLNLCPNCGAKMDGERKEQT